MSVRAISPEPSGLRSEVILIAVVVMIGLGALLYLASQRQQELRASPSGIDGLAHWLNANDIETRPFFGGWSVNISTVGLNVIPLYDTRLDRDRAAPSTVEELLFQTDEYDLRLPVLREKIAQVQSLVILPKWRTGMRLTGLAHPVLIAEPAVTASALAAILGRDVGPVALSQDAFSRYDYQSDGGETLSAELYIAQTFEGRGCQAIIGEVGRMVLGACPLSAGGQGSFVFILSDPDLLNNHGLRLGDNAWIARDLFQSWAGERTVFLDYSRRNWMIEERSGDVRERSWSDLARLFDYPFSLIWLAGGLALALTLWRSGLRFGPLPPEQTELGASSAQVVRVRARLLRLTGQDGALLGEFVTARLSATAARLRGPTYERRTNDEAAVLRHAARRDRALAHNLEQVLAEIRSLPPTLAAAEAIRYVDALEVCLERVTNDP